MADPFTIPSELVTTPNAITLLFILIIVFVGLSNLFKPISNFKAVNIPNYLIFLSSQPLFKFSVNAKII